MTRFWVAALPLLAMLPAATPLDARAAASAAAAPKIECHCRANGRDYALGARICLRAPTGYRLAECRMQQNVTSWEFGQEDCAPTAERGPDADPALALALLTAR
ncbi:MAG: hypothetical protein U1E52_09145 [Geminicoccaceae bacterium]